jgi:hypothetical protein
MPTQMPLDAFGELLIAQVRDGAVRRVRGVIDGTLKSADARAIHSALDGISSEQAAAVRLLAVEAIDSVLHRFLVLIDETDVLELSFVGDGQRIRVRDVSDGLAGELYSSDGWIARFSKERL